MKAFGHRSFAAILVASSLLLVVGRAPAETKPGQISGQVLGPDGKPVANASVHLGIEGSRSPSPPITTDDDGRFLFSDLQPAAYRIGAFADDLVDDSEEAAARVVRLGESVTLRLEKGGVVTGKVTDRDGQPLVAVPVRAIRIRNADGRRSDRGWSPSDRTDDRGIYRIFGLEHGTYLIATGAQEGQTWGQVNAHDRDAPTYYPSSTRETAAPVSVSTGQEVTGIDISYRGDTGRTVSGKVVGPVATSRGWCNVILTRPNESETIASTSAENSGTSQIFNIPGVPDGEYELRANRWSDGATDGYYSLARRISVRGADVTGVVLELVEFGTISGKLVVEKSSTTEACEGDRPSTASETVIMGIRTGLLPRGAEDTVATPGADGEFSMPFLKPATFHLDTRLPSKRWYVRAITRADSATTHVNYEVDGIALSQGKKPNDVTVVVAEGAGSVSGHIGTSAPGGALPPSARVYLIPVEDAKPAAHYYTAWVLADETFRLENLAPGQYLAIVRSEPDDATFLRPDPAFWELAGRAKLRREAKLAPIPIEVKRCEDVKDVVLTSKGK